MIIPYYKIRDREIRKGSCLCGYNKIEDGRCVRCGVPIIHSFNELVVDIDVLGKQVPYNEFVERKEEIEKEIEVKAFENLCKDLRIPVPAPIPDEEIEEEMRRPVPDETVKVKVYKVVEEDAEISKGRIFIQNEVHYYVDADIELVTFDTVFNEVLAEKGWKGLVGHKFYKPYDDYFRHRAKRMVLKVEFEVEEKECKQKSWKFLGCHIPDNLYIRRGCHEKV